MKNLAGIFREALALAATFSSDAICVWLPSSAGDGFWWREGEAQPFGYAPAQRFMPLSEDWRRERVHPDDLAALGQDARRFCQNTADPAPTLELRLLCADGRVRAVRASSRSLRDESGEMIGVITVIHDIAAQVETRASLQAELRYQRDVERALRKENRRRLLAEKIVRQQTQALAATLNSAAGKPSARGFIKSLLRAIVRECGGLFATYWNAAGGNPQGTREISFLSDQATEKIVECYAEAHLTEIADIARLYHAILKEERSLATLKANDPRFPAAARRLFTDLGIESIVLSPLLVGRRLLGWISFLTVEPLSRIGAGQLAFIEATTHQVALSLYLARLSDAEQKRALAEERNRIARDMHDLLAQSFSGIILQCEAALAEAASVPASVAERMEKIRRQAERGVEEVRRSLQMCRPAPLENGSLTNALAAMAAETAAYHPGAVRFIDQSNEEAIPAKVELQFFAIAAEALHNAVRHAQARTITIQLKFTRRRLTLSIQDDGRSFDRAQVMPRADGGHGLANMRERAKSLGARFTLQTKVGAGVKIAVAVELPPVAA